MRTLKHIIVLSFAFMILPACTKSDGQLQDQSDTREAAAKKVWTSQLISAESAAKRHLTGTIQAADAVNISFEVKGVIANMHVNLGQSFNKGELLAELDKAIYLLAVQQNKSKLGEADAALLEAKQTFKRNQTLREQSLVSQAAFDNSLAQFDISKQRVKVAQSGLDLAQKNLSDTRLIAPYSGRASARLVEPSQQVVAGAPVFSIQGNANLEVSAAIPEGLISKIKLFDRVEVVVPSLSSSDTYSATLTEIGAQASVANAFPITITFNDHHDGFYPGMSAEIILSVGSPFASSAYYEIPFSAFSTDKTGPFVYVIQAAKPGSGNIAQKHYIDIAEFKQETVIIKFKQDAPFDINPDSRIVKTGLDFLRPDQSVSVVETNTRIYNQ